jgi:apolipoprotein N-acyltransferase
VYGDLRLRQFEKIEGPGLQVALVQGNVSIAEKHDIKYFTLNRQRYLELSEIAAKPGTLVIWPESVLNEFVPDSIENVLDDKRLPYFGPKVGVLFGGLTYKSEQEYFNSAIAVLPSGLVLPPYHKQILMPFGEFTPFSDSLPWLKEINHTAGNFTPGRKQAVFQYPLGENGAEIGVAPLICYEDIVPAMALQAVRAGAQILVNLTNDAWFGDTVAPAQHHLIAAWRAIENRRYLLRSTNAGLTAVVSPTGQTIAALPTFEEGLLIERVHPLNAVSPYNTYFGASFELCVLAFAFASIAGFWLRRRFSSR